MSNYTVGHVGAGEACACNCIGPQNGQPLCPCQMRGVFQRNGRWIMPERDLGPVSPGFDPEATGAFLRALSATPKGD